MKNKIVTLALSSVVAASAMFPVFQEYSYAAPANYEEQSFEQPSGERFSATQYGGEWFNWAATRKGEVLIQDEKGYWTYAKLETES